MRGSETAGTGDGGLQALLESANVDLVAFYKNLNDSLAADEDDAYHVFARRCGSRGVLTEDCDPAEIVFDHLVFTRTATSDGGFAFDVVALTAENPVGTALELAPVNPFGEPSAPDPSRRPTATTRAAIRARSRVSPTSSRPRTQLRHRDRAGDRGRRRPLVHPARAHDLSLSLRAARRRVRRQRLARPHSSCRRRRATRREPAARRPRLARRDAEPRDARRLGARRAPHAARRRPTRPRSRSATSTSRRPSRRCSASRRTPPRAT